MDRTASPASIDAKMRVQVLDPLAVPKWDALVTGLAGHSFFHGAAWARVLEESYGYTPAYLAAMEGAELRALLPMMEVNSWLTGKRGVSLPFTDACPAIGAETQHLFQEATRIGHERGWKFWEARGGSGLPAGGVPFTPCCEHHLSLAGGEEKVFAGFEASVRRAIRKSEKEGVVVELSRDMSSVRTFYKLHCQTRRKHGVPPQPFSFFTSLHRHVIAHNLGFVVVARSKDRPVAAGVFVHLGAKAIYKYGASDESMQHLRGANLVMWHAIQWYARAGFESFDFGRTAPSNVGLRRFKLGWGSVESPLEYFRYDLKMNRFVSGLEESPGWSNRVFQRIPLPISRLIGRALYRHVA